MSFVYAGGSPVVAGHPFLENVDGRWNPKHSMANGAARSPAFHVWFFGSGAGCPRQASNGPVVRLPQTIASKTTALTGISPDLLHPELSWTPASDSTRCTQESGSSSGPAFVVANQQPGGGMGLFTDIGNDGPIGQPHFWREFGNAGQTGTGANRGIEGTFITWTFDWRNGQTVYPWPLSAAASEGPGVLLRSTQSVATAFVAPQPKAAGPSQVKQQYAISFINRVCERTMTQRRYCQVRYLFHTTVVRAGYIDWPGEKWANHAHLLLDPAQQGLPVLYGPLKASGRVTDAGIADLGLWRSRGAETAHGTFTNRTFAAEITFRQFVNGLRLIAARVLAKHPRMVESSDLAAVFGGAWDRPRAWVLASANAGQEVHSDSPRYPAYLGGAIRSLEVLAARE